MLKSLLRNLFPCVAFCYFFNNLANKPRTNIQRKPKRRRRRPFKLLARLWRRRRMNKVHVCVWPVPEAGSRTMQSSRKYQEKKDENVYNEASAKPLIPTISMCTEVVSNPPATDHIAEGEQHYFDKVNGTTGIAIQVSSNFQDVI